MSASFVGRHGELSQLADVVAQGRRRGAAGLVVGVAGAGKSRLLGEAVARAASTPVVRAVGFEPMQSVPLAAAGELLRRLAALPGPGEQVERLVFDRSGAGAPHDALRIFEASARALAAVGPLLVAADDLQWFDEQSLALLHYLLSAAEAGGHALALLAASRPSPAATTLATSLRDMVAAGRGAVVELGPLPLQDGMALARGLDTTLDDDTARQLWSRAHGSPFWLERLLRRGGETHAGALPGAIDAHLSGLDGDSAELMALLAVAARPMLIDDLAAALSWEHARARYVAGRLVASGLAVEVAGSLEVVHDLIRESVTAALPDVVVRRHRAALAEVIEAAAGDDLGLLCEALEHRTAAGLAATPLATRLLTAPGRRLLGVATLRLLAGAGDSLQAGTPGQVDFDRRLGELAAQLGEQELALQRWVRAARGATDPRGRIDAEVGAAAAAFALRRPEAARFHLDAARGVAAPLDDVAAAQIDALDAVVSLWLTHDGAAGAESAARALATAQRMAAAAGGVDRLRREERAAYLAAVEAGIDAALQQTREDDVVALSEAVIPVTASIDEEDALATVIRAAFALRTIGRLDGAESLYRRAWEASRRLGLPSMMAQAGAELARTLRSRGRLREARDIAAETAALEARLGTAPRRWGNAPSLMHHLDLYLGEPDAALAALRGDAAAEPDPHYRMSILHTAAMWQARAGGARLAVAVRADVAAARHAADQAGCARCSADLAAATVEMLARVGDVEAARAARSAWPDAVADRRLLLVWTSWADAALALAEGDPVRATTLLETVAAELEALGIRQELLWARLDLGRAGEMSGDRSRAVAAFTAAAALAEEMGAVTPGRLATQALRRLGVRAWRRGTASGGAGLAALSGREREVADLAARGRSNDEIGAALLLSPRTVERHLTNVLAKLALRNRTELAALLGSPSLVRGSPDD